MKSISDRPLRRKPPSRTREDRQKLAAETAALMESSISYIDSEDFRAVPRDELLAEPATSVSAAGQQPSAPSGTPPYLAALYEFPIFNREQEYQIFRKMHFLRSEAALLRDRLSLSALSAQRVRRIQELLRSADEVRNRIVQCNLRLVVSIAKMMVDSANSLEDLISEGNFPLIRAAELFNYTRGLRFSTYATWAIRNGLYRTSGRNRRTQQRFRPEEPDWMRHVPAVKAQREEVEALQESERLRQLVSQLDDRSQIILRDRFGLGDQQRPARFRELAAKLKLSSERVRQLLEHALNQLRSLDCPDYSRRL